MAAVRAHPVAVFFNALPGWLMMAAGLAVLGACLLFPVWQENQQLQWRLNLMRQQADRLAQLDRDYQRFHEAIVQRDPILLQRLAFYHLRLKPTDADLLLPVQPLTPDWSTVSLQRNLAAPSAVAAPPLPVETLLSTHIPTALDVPPPPPAPDTLLMRLTIGDLRPVGLSLGLVIVYLGLVWPREERTPARATHSYHDLDPNMPTEALDAEFDQAIAEDLLVAELDEDEAEADDAEEVDEAGDADELEGAADELDEEELDEADELDEAEDELADELEDEAGDDDEDIDDDEDANDDEPSPRRSAA